MSDSFLLDTHAIYWAGQIPGKLSVRAKSAVHSGRVIVSVASLWEIIIKTRESGWRRGTLPIADPIVWWSRVVESLAGQVLPIRANHVAALDGLPSIHRDPFDRILIAQAVADGLTLVTNDEIIQAYPIKTRW